MKKPFRKLVNKIKNIWIIRRCDYPKELRFYKQQFKMNSWDVIRNHGYSSSEAMTIMFDGIKVARVTKMETSPIIREIEMIHGYEELHALVIQVLKSASQEGVNREKEEENKKQELIKQAYNETKWLGPY